MNNSNTELKNILGNDPDELVGVVSELGEKSSGRISFSGGCRKGFVTLMK